jgi:hypothetical protein
VPDDEEENGIVPSLTVLFGCICRPVFVPGKFVEAALPVVAPVLVVEDFIPVPIPEDDEEDEEVPVLVEFMPLLID